MDKARKEMLAEASSNYTESIFESIKHVNAVSYTHLTLPTILLV